MSTTKDSRSQIGAIANSSQPNVRANPTCGIATASKPNVKVCEDVFRKIVLSECMLVSSEKIRQYQRFPEYRLLIQPGVVWEFERQPNFGGPTDYIYHRRFPLSVQGETASLPDLIGDNYDVPPPLIGVDYDMPPPLGIGLYYNSDDESDSESDSDYTLYHYNPDYPHDDLCGYCGTSEDLVPDGGHLELDYPLCESCLLKRLRLNNEPKDMYLLDHLLTVLPLPEAADLASRFPWLADSAAVEACRRIEQKAQEKRKWKHHLRVIRCCTRGRLIKNQVFAAKAHKCELLCELEKNVCAMDECMYVNVDGKQL